MRKGFSVTQQKIAPVVLLGYHRPELTAEVFETIRKAQPRQLFLVMDGPNPAVLGDAALVSRTRAVVELVDWKCEVRKIYAPHNLGLKKRVYSGLNQVFAEVDYAIVLEDDCLPSDDFFQYCSELLALYDSDEKVGIVSGASRFRGRQVTNYSYDFSEDVRIWGWATWGRTWNTFADSGDINGVWTRQDAKRLSQQFPRGARRKAMFKMLTASSDLDSWALPFAVHCRQRGYLNAVPEKNLVTNIGLGPSSTHTKFESYVAEVDREKLGFPLRHPGEVKVNPAIDEVESRLDAAQLYLYPLVHPWDTFGRLFRYFKHQIFGRKSPRVRT